MKFGVFTVCMPEYDIPESIALLADLGYDGIEFRVKELVEETEEGLASHNPDNKQYPYRYWGYNKSTLDVNNIMEEAKKAKALCDEHGLDVFGLSGYVGADDPETLRKIFEAAKAIDCEIVRVGLVTFDPEKANKTYPEAFAAFRKDLKVVEGIAKEVGVKGVIELHHGTLTPSASAAIRALEGLDPEYIGVIYDPGNMVYEGYERYINGLQILGDYVAHVHVKNASLVPGKRAENGEVIWEQRQNPLTEGSVNFADLFKALRAVGYDHTISVEDFSNEATTEEKLRSNLEFLKKL